MSRQLHRRIGTLALDRGWIDPEELCEIMLVVGRLGAEDDVPAPEVWNRRGWLEGHQLDEVLDTIGSKSLDRDSYSRFERQETGSSADLSEETTARIEEPGANLESGDPAFSERVEARSPNKAAADSPEEFDTHTESPPFPATDSEAETLAPAPPPGSPPSPGLPTDPDLPEDGARDARKLVWSLIESGKHEPLPAAEGDSSQFTHPESTPTRPLEAQLTGDTEPAEAPPEHFDELTEVSAANAEEAPALDPGERFILDEELGRGGSGRVVRAYDRLLGRTVALKILQADAETNPDLLSRFIAEAQATGQLEHPNIVPIYDFGVLPTGNPFYTMREVRGHSLRQVLRRLQDEEEAADEYTLVRLLNILRQVSQAVDYAHSRSVIHRDIKPDNVMLGDFGEVLVMDWGLAQVLDREQANLGREDSNPFGHTLGTPSYMPPEQAQGKLHAVDETSDIYSLGAVLYELLTLSPPFYGDGPIDIMWEVVDGQLPPPSRRAPEGRNVPEELERICMRALRRDQGHRYQSVRDFHDDLEAWIEGIQPRESQRRIEEARRAAQEYRSLVANVEDYDEKARRLRNQIDKWEPIDQKRRLWQIQDKRDDSEVASARAFSKAVTLFTQSLAHEPDNDEARRELADLYWERLRRAEMRQDVHDAYYFKSLVEQYDPGKYEPHLEGHTQLRVLTEPEATRVRIFELKEVDRQLVTGPAYDLGEAPVEVDKVPLGKYLLKLSHPERLDVRRPVYVERDRDAHIHLRLPHSEEAAEDFVYVPAGDFIAGGDPDAFHPRQPERRFVNSFFCSKFPVTFGEYLEFFNALYAEHGEAAMPRAPQTREAEGLLINWDDHQDKWVPDDVLIEGEARERYPAGEGYDAQIPVLGIRAEDAEAYCRWRSERDGRTYRLPTANELEKAGRGVDGRRFPWGNTFDATFCKMRFSRPEKPPQPEPVGAFPADVSPYGVRDLAGGIQEWCQAAQDGDQYRPVKGGGWGQDERVSHMASTLEILASARNSRIGFRLVYDLHD